jgi:hypothetical protein
MEQYWIGKGVDYDELWSAYEQGGGYIDKYHSMEVHLLRLTLREHPTHLPLFNFEAVFKTVKGYFHDLKEQCLTRDEYRDAGPLFIYRVERSSGVWEFLGELRQLLMLGTTLADEKVMGQRLENIDKKIEFLRQNFGTAAKPEDFQRFMKARTPRQLERAIQKLFEQGILKVEISVAPFSGDIEATEKTLVELKSPKDEQSRS